jgi:hypothetical protein
MGASGISQIASVCGPPPSVFALAIRASFSKVPVERWKVHAESVAQQMYVVPIRVVRRIAGVMGDLHRRTEAADALIGDDAGGEAAGRVQAIPAVRRRALLPARAIGVKGDWVNVNLPTGEITQDQSHGAQIFSHGETQGAEHVDGAVGLAQRQHHIKIVMGASLLANEGVNAPTAIEPERDAAGE